MQPTTAPTVEDSLLSPRDVCRILRIGRTKFWDLIGSGVLDVVRLGNRCTRVKRSSVDRLIQRGGTSTEAA